MNGQIGMRAFSMLLAVLLVSMIVMPVASATSINTGLSDVSSVYRVTDLSNPIIVCGNTFWNLSLPTPVVWPGRTQSQGITHLILLKRV